MPGAGVSGQEKGVRLAGAIVRLNAKAFGSLLVNEPVELVISSPRYLLRTSVAGRGVGRRGAQYLAVSRGVLFHTITKTPLSVPGTIKTIQAEDIWVSLLGLRGA
jgi:hypothetical protein